eukprot:scaffold118377_cov27-Phaeocystis_antarctica.AAC.1
MRCPLGSHLHHQATPRAVIFRILTLLGAAAVSSTGAATLVGTGLTQPPASGLHPWVEHRAALVRVSLDRLVTGRASSQRYPSDPEGVACPAQWLPVLLAGTPLPPTRHRRLPTTPGVSGTEAEGMRALSESGCADTDGTATDTGGKGCSWYTWLVAPPSRFNCMYRSSTHDTYVNGQLIMDDTDFTASTMCCACGG